MIDPLNKKKTFALIGASGFVAPRHMAAVKALGHEIVAACDPSDSVGILDSYFPKASFFTEFERFDRHLEKLKRVGQKVDFLIVCSPNYLHDAHIRYGLRYGSNVICEKPLVLNPWNVDALKEMEDLTGKNVFTILQLRLHPAIIALKAKIGAQPSEKKREVTLTYITSRGLWYYASWKGSLEKSGGIATNIGVHFFDMLMWVFGDVKSMKVYQHTHDRSSGSLELEHATIKWFLSINADTLPAEAIEKGHRTYRQAKVDDEDIPFSDGFENLHTMSYDHLLSGKGFGLKDADKSIQLMQEIRTAPLTPLDNEAHDLCQLPQSKHPFT